MKYNEFENLVKTKLSEAEEPVQIDALLSVLNLSPKKKKKNYRLLMFLLPLIALVSYGAYAVINTEVINFSNQNSDFKNELAVKSSNSLEALPNSKSSITNRSNITTPVLSNHNENINIEKSNSKSRLPNTENRKQSIIKNKNSVNSVMPQNYRSNTNLLSELIATKKIITPSNYSFKSESKTNLRLNNTIVNNRNTVLENVNSVSLLQVEKQKTAVILESVDLLDSRLIELEPDIDEGIFDKMKINCPSFSPTPWRFGLIPEIGIFTPFKTLKNKGQEVSDVFVKRSNNEHSLEGLNVGLYGMMTKDDLPFYLKLGVSYSRISERIKNDFEYSVQDTTVGIVSSTVSSNGDTITHIYGDIISETIYRGVNTRHHYIQLVDLPISVGYVTYIGNFNIGIEGGVQFNVLTNVKGQLLSAADSFTELPTGKMFKNRVGLSYFGSLMIDHSIGKFGDIYIAPRFTYYKNDFSTSSNPISQEYFTIGVNVGMVYRL
ncbi:MAG: hypothetical protein V3V14_13965 [Saprospiraceae bacterium]